ncbi:oleate hydratase [Aspergillus cavernicola]|uniref:Oleate hydratase n=1 Tax=Aspergillus cavernicola TaxID=176166 RepID=A0ABR4I7J6_9EURO
MNPPSDAWIFGSGTAALASALYLVRRADFAPQQIHILDSHRSLSDALHHPGDPSTGYDQFAGCLPVPVGEPLQQLLALVPSVSNATQSVFDEIQTAELRRDSDTGSTEDSHTRFLVQRGDALRIIPTQCLNLNMRQRLSLFRLLLKREKSLQRKQIRDYLPPQFFKSTFWAIWSAQFGFQPWHSASEFRRTIRQYLRDFHGLNILSCLDITGHYQFEATFLPMYHFLRSRGVDFLFDVRVRDIVTEVSQGKQVVTRIDLVENGYEVCRPIGKDDIVIVTLGSTVSGSTTGTNEDPPSQASMQASEALDENWSLWLELGGKYDCFGDPYNFCTNKSESMLESFTVTTEDLGFYQHLSSLVHCPPQTGVFVALQESPWQMNLCLPMQPVFSEQPSNVRVFWGFANFPGKKGKYVKKTMLGCSGSEILTELLGHLHLESQYPMGRTMTVPRLMPRMSAILLARAIGDRPGVIPRGISNLGLVGQFSEMSQYSCVDMSYSVRTAQRAVSHLTGSKIEQGRELHGYGLSTFFRILLTSLIPIILSKPIQFSLKALYVFHRCLDYLCPRPGSFNPPCFESICH